MTVLRPKYQLRTVALPVGEGEVQSSEYSIFYGIGDDRKELKLLDVFDDSSQREPFDVIEVIDDQTLLEIFDGRVFFFRKSKTGC
jgi:hypothetical protein